MVGAVNSIFWGLRKMTPAGRRNMLSLFSGVGEGKDLKANRNYSGSELDALQIISSRVGARHCRALKKCI